MLPVNIFLQLNIKGTQLHSTNQWKEKYGSVVDFGCNAKWYISVAIDVVRSQFNKKLP